GRPTSLAPAHGSNHRCCSAKPGAWSPRCPGRVLPAAGFPGSAAPSPSRAVSRESGNGVRSGSSYRLLPIPGHRRRKTDPRATRIPTCRRARCRRIRPACAGPSIRGLGGVRVGQLRLVDDHQRETQPVEHLEQAVRTDARVAILEPREQIDGDPAKRGGIVDAETARATLLPDRATEIGERPDQGFGIMETLFHSGAPEGQFRNLRNTDPPIPCCQLNFWYSEMAALFDDLTKPVP